MNAPPGWYPDPYDRTRRRWWDGRAWGPPAPATATPRSTIFFAEVRRSLPTGRQYAIVLGTFAVAVLLIVLDVVPRVVTHVRERGRAVPMAAPVDVTLRARRGVYQVYERIPDGAIPADMTADVAWPLHLTPADVTVTDDHGRAVPVRKVDFLDTGTFAGHSYRSSVEFDVVEPGTYTVRVGATPVDVVVAAGGFSYDPFTERSPLGLLGFATGLAGLACALAFGHRMFGFWGRVLGPHGA